MIRLEKVYIDFLVMSNGMRKCALAYPFLVFELDSILWEILDQSCLTLSL